VAALLDSLRRAGAPELVAALLRRDPAAHVRLGYPHGLAALLGSLRKAGAHEQVTALLRRDPAAHVRLDDLDNLDNLDGSAEVAALLDSLREAGAHEQATALAGRLPAAGQFKLFLKQNGLADQFRFGREADGTPATPWGWEDLD
jgi:hypothetical protein